MPFVLPDDAIIQLRKLRQDYEKIAEVDLKSTPQPYAIRLFFGAKDIESRNGQISFIEQWIAHFQKDLSETNTFDSLDALQHHISALRCIMAVCFYVKFKIEGTYTLRSGASAVLGQLINKAIGINSDNMMDKETEACCLLAAKHYLAGARQFEAFNADAQALITQKQWSDFSYFITRQWVLLDKKYQIDYPITSIMMPIFAQPMKFAGYATGYVLGDMTSQLLPTRYALMTMIGSCVFAVMGTTSTVGTMLVAGRVLDTFCGISLAWVMGTTLNLVGKGVGFGVGMSLDLSWKLLYNACSLLTNLYHNHSKLTGISLIDGHRVTDGVHLQFEELANLCEKSMNDIDEPPVEINVDETGFTITINGQLAKFHWLDFKQPDLEELKRMLTEQSILAL